MGAPASRRRRRPCRRNGDNPPGTRRHAARRAVAPVLGASAEEDQLLPDFQDADRAEHGDEAEPQGGGLGLHRPAGGRRLRHAPGDGEAVPFREAHEGV